MSDAVIIAATIGAAHEGKAELVVTLRHDNGGLSEIPLDEGTAALLLDQCGAQCIEELTGCGWQQVRDAIVRSFADTT
jgi:hypothetical protein